MAAEYIERMEKSDKKRRRGRPEVGDENLRNHMVQIRLKHHEIIALDALCDSTGESRSGFVRRVLKKALTSEA
jgi:hypothetical protein